MRANIAAHIGRFAVCIGPGEQEVRGPSGLHHMTGGAASDRLAVDAAQGIEIGGHPCLRLHMRVDSVGHHGVRRRLIGGGRAIGRAVLLGGAAL